MAIRIEFLGMAGCPNTPLMRASLQRAIEECGGNIAIESLDLVRLSDDHDVRAGYGSPTILVNGVDLFGMPLPGSYDPACRYYQGRIPDAGDILARLRLLVKQGDPG